MTPTLEVEREILEHVARKIGKIARPKRIVWADELPKTRSGKIMRRVLRSLAEGRDAGDLTTLRDRHCFSVLTTVRSTSHPRCLLYAFASRFRSQET